MGVTFLSEKSVYNMFGKVYIFAKLTNVEYIYTLANLFQKYFS